MDGKRFGSPKQFPGASSKENVLHAKLFENRGKASFPNLGEGQVGLVVGLDQ